MSLHKWAAPLLVLGLAVASPAVAQQKSVSLAVAGGGFNGVTNLNDPGTADFQDTGYSLGATVGVDLSRYVALRGDFTFARNQLRLNDANTGSHLNRFFYGAALQVQYPGEQGWTPYAFVGGGAVTLDPADGPEDSHTKGAGLAGVGLSYTIPGTNFGIGVEGQGWLYGFSKLDGNLAGYDKRQFEVTWSAKASYHIPINASARD